MSGLRILDEAADELAAAIEYLEGEREGTAKLFLTAYGEKLAQIVRFPMSAPLIANAPKRYELRAFLLRGFRYVVIAGVVDGVSTIVAVAHTRRAPGYWRNRLTR